MRGRYMSSSQWLGELRGIAADAVTFGEFLFNCTTEIASLQVLEMAGAANLRGKILMDVANALGFSRGMPSSLAICNTDLLGEQIQQAFSEARVVKTLNIVNCAIMVTLHWRRARTTCSSLGMILKRKQ